MPLSDEHHRRKRSEVRSYVQQLVERVEPDVLAVARQHAAARVAALTVECGLGLVRARRREDRLAEIVAGDTGLLVQAGLFDRSWVKERTSSRRGVPAINRDPRIGVSDAQLVLILIHARRS